MFLKSARKLKITRVVCIIADQKSQMVLKRLKTNYLILPNLIFNSVSLSFEIYLHVSNLQASAGTSWCINCRHWVLNFLSR